jgi:hypothetical protein
MGLGRDENAELLDFGICTRDVGVYEHGRGMERVYARLVRYDNGSGIG